MSSVMEITKAVQAVCPIDGISIGNMNDNTTWTLQLLPEATPDQITAGQVVLTSYTQASII